jgi:phosphatidylserine synthase
VILFIQANLLAIVLLCIVATLVLLITISKIDLKRNGKITAFTIITLIIFATLLLMKETLVGALFLKVFVVIMMLFVWWYLFSYLKKRFQK